ncbi:MAG: cytidylyltransferase domain-containing protein, partial [Blastocatellia bacterium]
DLPRAFHREGSVYVTRRDVVMRENSLYGARLLGYEMNADRSVNIDSIEDWERAERLLLER